MKRVSDLVLEGELSVEKKPSLTKQKTTTTLFMEEAQLVQNRRTIFENAEESTI